MSGILFFQWFVFVRSANLPSIKAMILRRLLLFFFFALREIAMATSPADPEVFNIKTYSSPSGRFELEVDPTESDGGPGDCTLKKDGRLLWNARLPFSFHEALIADDGTVAGYGYAVPDQKDEDWLRVAIFGPDGKQRLDQRFAAAFLEVKGICLHDERFTVVIGNSGLCRSYRTSDGKSLGVTEPPVPVIAGENHPDCLLFAVAQVAGTPLTLLHWRVEERKQTSTDQGAIFTLIDATGAQVWELIALGDYNNPDKGTERRIMAMVYESGAIFKGAKAGTFELWLAKGGWRVSYAVERKDGKWRVEEVNREPQELTPPTQKKTVRIEVPELEKLGSFTLDAPPSQGPVSDVSAFGFDGHGRIGYLRGRGHFVHIEKSGALLVEVPLKLPQELDANAKVLLTWLADDRWLVTASTWDRNVKTGAWRIDARTKTLTEVDGSEYSRIDSLAGAKDGGFLALTRTPEEDYSTNLLGAFDAAAKKRWSMAADRAFTTECFCTPDSVTVTSRGEVAVLDGIRATVHFYDLGGKHLRTVDLEKEWKIERASPLDITADADGGFIVRKSIGEPTFVRMTAEGKVRAEFTMKFKDGRIPYRYGKIRVAPDGRMWQNNHHNFVRLGDDGVVDEIVGIKPDEDQLGVISVAACDAKGLIYLADDQTGAVHVFAPDGRKLRICKPTKTDTPGNLRSPNLAVTDGGRVYLRGDWCDERYIEFAPDGSREKTVPADHYNEWYGCRGNGGMLMMSYDGILLTDKELATKRTISRWPDRRWFDCSESAAVADDGSFVVLGGSGPERGLLGFYSPEGDPQRMARVPVDWDTERLTLSGWNRKHIVISDRSTSVICDSEGKPVHLLQVPAEEGKWAQFITNQGRELWVLEFQNRKITRYAMPAEK
jgi:sugar lactone lactonase YvrE